MKHQELRRGSSLRLSDENREHSWERIGSHVKLQQKQRRENLMDLGRAAHSSLSLG